MFIFHKTEIQTVILRCLTSLNLNWYKSYDTEGKNTNFANVCFWTKSQKNGNGNICVLCHNFWTNQNLNQVSTSKWPSELQFCERCTYIWQKMARNGLKTVIYKGTFISNQSLFVLPMKKWRKKPEKKRWRYCQSHVKIKNWF